MINKKLHFLREIKERSEYPDGNNRRNLSKIITLFMEQIQDVLIKFDHNKFEQNLGEYAQ